PLQTQQARITLTARFVCSGRVVARASQAVVDAELHATANDLGLGQADQWCVDMQPLPFDRSLGGEIGHPLIRGDVLGAAVWISAVIESIDPQENVVSSEYLGPSQCKGKENSVTSGHVGNWYAGAHFLGPSVLRHVDVRSEGRAPAQP